MATTITSTVDPAADVFQARAELYAPSRLPPKALELFRTRALVTDVVAQQCWLVVLALARLRLETNPRDGDGVPRVAIIGGGHMGCAVAMALLDHAYPPHRILISTRQPERLPQCDALATAADQTRFQQIPRVFDNARASRESDVLVLCVPPSQLKSLAIQIRHAPCVVVSVLSGTRLETLQKACGSALVLRTAVDVPQLSAALAQYDQDTEAGDARIHDSADNNSSADPVDHDTALEALRQRAEALSVEHLAMAATNTGSVETVSPLARVLADLARRLDHSLDTSRAEELVAAVLTGATSGKAASSEPMESEQAEARLSSTALDEQNFNNSSSNATASGPQEADETDAAEPRWLASWTPSLEQLQRVWQLS